MAIKEKPPLKIVLWPEPVLLKKTRPLSLEEIRAGEFDGMRIDKFIEDMRVTMADSDGLGLAAPQVGVSVRICVVNPARADKNYPEETVMINPVVTRQAGEFTVGEEGCLSFPGIYGKVRRRLKIIMEYLDMSGEPHVLEWKDFPARVVLHELDHLDGVVFIDRMDAVERGRLRLELERLRERYRFLARRRKNEG